MTETITLLIADETSLSFSLVINFLTQDSSSCSNWLSFGNLMRLFNRGSILHRHKRIFATGSAVNIIN